MKKSNSTDSIATNENTILHSLIKFNSLTTKEKEETLQKEYKMASASPLSTASCPAMTTHTKNPIMFTKEEAEVSSKWKKYIYKIHTLIMDEIPNMCLVNKSNTLFEYESSCGQRKVKFLCRFEGIPHQQFCTGVIIDNDTPIYHKTKKTPKRLYRSLIRYIDDYYVDYILDLNKKYSGPYPAPMPTLCLDEGITPDTPPSALCPISPVANHKGQRAKEESDFYDDIELFDSAYDSDW